MSDTLRGRANPIAQLDRFMWMPGGIHTITLDRGGKPHRITVQVDDATATTLQSELDQRLAAGEHRPFFDFHHDEKEASAWPTRFVWQDAPAPGVYAEVEWSARGRESIEGKVYRAFSPAFYARPLIATEKNPARITGAPFCMGGLVNDPAFKKISPLWAKNAAGAQPSSAKQNNNSMNEEQKAALQAKLTELEQSLEALRAGNQSADTLKSIEDAEAEAAGIKLQLENEELRAKNAEFQRKEAAARKANAEAAVADAVRQGKIPSKDEKLQAKWVESITADPTAIALLSSMPGHPALQARRITLGNSRASGPVVDVLTEDIRDVCRAYSRETDPRRKGAFYAQNIAKRFDEFLDAPLKAADTYAGDLVVQRTLELLKFEFPMLSRITTDFSGENAYFNQEINTRIVSVPSVVAYHTTNGYVATSTTTTDVPVTIDTHSSVPITFNANVLASTARQLFGEQLPAMHYALGKAMVDALLALIVAGTYTNTAVTEAEVDFDRGTVIDLGTSLTTAGVPMMGRTLLLNSAYYGKLLEDTVIANLGASQQAGIITGNRLPQVHGFDVIEVPNLPSTGNLTGFAHSKSALVIAARVPNDPSTVLPGVTGGGVTRVITNPDTGLSVLMIQNVDLRLGHASVILAWMYGVAAGQVAAGTILKSA